MAAYTLEALIEIIADEVKAQVAMKKHPNDLEAAVNYVFSAPDSDFEQMPPVTLPAQDSFAVNGAPPFGAQTPSSELPAYSSTDNWKTIPASQAAQHASATDWQHNENVAPTTSPYFQMPSGTNVPTQPSSSVSNQAFGPHRPMSPPPSRPVVHTIDDTDDEMERVIKASIEDQGGPGASAGWSAQSGSWQHNDVDMSSANKASNNKSVVLKEPSAEEQEDPELAWALKDSLTSSTRAPSPAPQKAFEDELSPMDQLRPAEDGSPVVLRVNSPFLGVVPVLMQALYASEPFRKAVLALALPQPAADFHFTYGAYWRGDATWPLPEQASPFDSSVCILAAIQRLFVFMTFTKRKIINIQDIVVALDIRPEQHMMREPAQYSRGLVDRILGAWQEVVVHLRTSNPTEGDEELYQARLRVCIMSGMEWTHNTEHAPPANDAGSIPILVSPPDCNDLHSAIANSITYNAEQKKLMLLDRKPDMLVLLPYRDPWGEKDMETFGLGKKAFQFDEKIWVDRYEVARKEEILAVRQKQGELLEKKRGLESRKALLSVHQGKDMFETMRSTIGYYEKIARPKDEEHGKKQEAMKLKLQQILSLMQVEVDSINEQLLQINKDLAGLFDADEWKKSPPYQLSAVTMSDGLPGSKHVFAYVKAQDGQWYKATNDNKVELSSLETLQADASGLHMRSGAYTLIYTTQRQSDQGTQGETAQELLDAVNLDNHNFKAQYPDELTSNWNLPPLSENAGDTTITSMQMDEQVHFTDVSEDEPSPVDIRLEEPGALEAQMAAILPPASVMATSSVPMSTEIAAAPTSNPPADIMDEPNPTPASIPSPIAPVAAPEASSSAYRSPSIQPSSPEKATSPPQQLASDLSPHIAATSAQSPATVRDDSSEDEIEFTGANPPSVEAAMRLRGGGPGSEDSVDYDSADSDEGNVFLGKVEPLEGYNVWTLQGLVGGRPFWINPVWPLSKEELTCGHCRRDESMRLLLELSAAPDDDESAHIRYIYVFTCISASCLAKAPTKSIRVFRMQLPKENNYHPLDVDIATNEQLVEKESVLKSARDFFDDAEKHLCPVCRLRGTVLCSQCKRQNYCGKAHQKAAWSSHKAVCKQPGPDERLDFFDPPELSDKVLRAAVWPAYQVKSQDEPGRLPSKRKRSASNASGRKEVVSQAEAANSEDTQEPETQTAADTSFLDFTDRVARQPDQVLRYYRINPSGHGDDSPIWISSKGQNPDLDSIPACENCGAPRTAELQIMPAILTRLGIDDSEPDSFDFGTIVIYTCSNNCLWPVSPEAERRFAATESTWRPVHGWATEVAVCQMNDEEELDLGQLRRA